MANGLFMQLGPFFSSGALCTSPKLYHYSAGTTTLKDIWSDRDEDPGDALAQPFIGDANGVFNFFGDGLYKFVIKDSSDNTLYTLDNVLVDDLTNPTLGEGASVPSASTTVLGSEVWGHITGTTPIDAFSGTVPFFWAVFDGALTLNYSSNLLLFGSVNRKVNAGDVILFLNEGSGVWRQGSDCPPSKPTDIASASSITPPAHGAFVDITGATTMAAIATINAGYRFTARFTGVGLNIIHNATSMLCPFGTDYRTVQNELIEFISLGSGNWIVNPLSGAPHLEPGTLIPGWFTSTAPTGGLIADATAVNCTTYHALAKKYIPDADTLGNSGTSLGTFTADASTNVITLASHGLAVNDIVHVTTSAADLPLGLAINTVYYVLTVPTGSTMTLSATRGGSTLDIQDAGTGTHTMHHKVNLPDLRGRVWMGLDNLGGSAASRITSASTNGGNSTTLGGAGGAQTHTLQTSESPAHTHNVTTDGISGGAGALSGYIFGTSTLTDADQTDTTTSSGGGGAHSNTQPWMAGGIAIRF